MAESNASKHENMKSKSSPKDVFLHILMIGALYVSTFMISSLWFDYINFWFPDKLNYNYRAILEGILVGTSTLIVIFPVYLLTSWLLEKEIKMDKEKREMLVRKWLIYLTLFVSAIAIIVEVVRLVYNFLSGELTMNFFLKILVVLIVASVAFGYYLWDAKRKIGSVSNLPKYLAWTTGLIIFGSVALSFFLVGSPAHQRAVRFDDQRLVDLQSIQGQVITYWQQKEALPPALPNLVDSVGWFVLPTDPDTRTQYEYIVKGPLAFELCATFGAKSIETEAPDRAYVSTPSVPGKVAPAESWSHEMGRTCFERTIDPEIWKINKPLPVIIQDKTAPAAVPLQ
ncbi:MAG: DUF5671 domain-containing protein [Candidatus Parcubacteria bacterium]|nr:DUF5671 domain-containing protein [Candidatus Parcubacteria bacterium]